MEFRHSWHIFWVGLALSAFPFPLLSADPSPTPVELPSTPAVPASSTPIQPSEPSLSAQDIHATAKDSVFRLSTHLEHANSRAEHGTAFVVDTSGFLVTNFHVIKDALSSQHKLSLKLELPSGEIPATVAAVDVVNDLALVKVDHTFPKALKVSTLNKVGEGAVVYSMGFPANDQLTFAQGNYGGEKLLGFITAGFASLPLNSGMSGGPMLNAEAEVIGVNRAKIANEQNLSFFSPLLALQEIVGKKNASGRAPATVSTSWRQEAVAAIRRQEKLAISHKPAASKRERLGKISFSIPLPNQTCGQGHLNGEETGLPYDAELFYCQSRSLTPLGNTRALEVTTVGHISHTTLQTMGDPMRNLLKSLYTKERKAVFTSYDKKKSTEAQEQAEKDGENCGLKNVRNSAGIQMSVSFCSLANVSFAGLISTFVRIEFPYASASGVSLIQFYQGLTAETTADVLEKFLESVKLEEDKS